MSTTPRLADATARFAAAEAELTAARDELHDAIRDELRTGARQVDVVRVTGYTREQIRRIALGRSDEGDQG